MSIGNLQYPNQNNIYVNSLTGNTLQLNVPPPLDDAATLLAINGAGQITTRGSASISSLAYAAFNLATSTNITNTTGTQCVFDTTATANSNITLSAGTLTFNATGYYTVCAALTMSTNTTGFRDFWFIYSGLPSIHLGECIMANSGAASQTSASITIARMFNAGDTLGCYGYQDSGATLTWVGSGSAADNYCNLTVTGIISTITYAAFNLATSTNITNTTATQCVFDTTVTANSNVTLAAGTLTFNATGYYTVCAALTMSTNTTGFRDFWFSYSGLSAIHLGECIVPNSGAASQTSASTTITRKFNAGDTLSCFGYQNSGATLTWVGSGAAADNYCNLTVTGIINQ